MLVAIQAAPDSRPAVRDGRRARGKKATVGFNVAKSYTRHWSLSMQTTVGDRRQSEFKFVQRRRRDSNP